MTEKLKMETKDIAQSNIEKIQKLFPNCIKEAKDEKGISILAIDFDILKQELSSNLIDDKKERYQLSWPEKKKSILMANSRTNSTLRPCIEKSKDFDNTKNLYIEGDNLEVLKLLQETYLHKIDVIYIDPPYNTGRNYIYKNDYSIKPNEFFKLDSQLDEDGNRLTQNQETNGRFHTDWLNMMYTRLKIARNLLTDDGILIVAIDENEFATLSIILKEIFGETMYEHSYVTVVHNPRGQQGNNFSYVNEYAIFVYPNNSKKYLADFPKKEIDARSLRDSGTDSNRTDARNCFYPFIVKDNKIVAIGDVPSNDYHPVSSNILRDDGCIEIWPVNDEGLEKKWRYARQTVESILEKLTIKSGRNNLQVIFNKNMETMKSVWEDSRYDASEYGTKVVQKLLNIKDGFSFPKSLWLMYDTLKATCSENKKAIILDFFSGSATTAHAVMKLNKEDNGNRKFILVQVPEKCSEKEEAIKKGFNTICDIGEERIRRAGDEIVNIGLGNNNSIDIGFRVLKLDSSNMNDVYYNPKSFSQSLLEETVDNIKSDRTPLELLFQVMLELGIELSSKIEEKEISGKKYYLVNDNNLIACFDDDLSNDVLIEIAKLQPLYSVFKDKSFSNDSVGINNEQIFKTYSQGTIIKVL